MEKYTQFADQSTGVNPFIPIWGQSKIPFIKRIINFPILVFRVVFLCLSLFMFAFFNIIMEIFYFDHLKIIFFSIFINGLSRVILLILGCLWISETIENLSQETNKSEFVIKKTRKLIFSNRQSFCDILLYSTTLGNPEYMFINKSGIFLISNSFSALLFSMGIQLNYKIKLFTEKNKFNIRHSISPLVIFMEEANTNGSCILKWNVHNRIPENIDMREKFSNNIELCTINYKLGSNYGPQFTTGDISTHLINMLYNITYFKIQLKIVKNECLKNYINSNKLSKTDTGVFKDLQNKKINEYLTIIQSVQEKMSNLPVVDRGIDDAEKFIDYWKKTNKGKLL